MKISSGIALCIAAAFLVPEVSWYGNSRRRPRNLVVITLDTMRADRLPAYGFSGLQTPTLDRLTSGGAVFEQAFAAAPLTLPSHTSLFTGMLPPRTRVRDNASPPLADDFTTLAEMLHSRGLKTAAFVGSSVLAPSRGLAQGFVTYRQAGPGCIGIPPRRRAAEVIDDALAWLGSSDHEPFYAWIHLFDAHRPYDLPDDIRNRHFDPYLGAIAYQDAQLGRVLRHLEARQLLHNTLIVVAGDHGESLGDHGEDAHGMLLYQEALRVPLILHGPGVWSGRAWSVARLIDVMPTILDLFDIPAPQMDGVSLTDIDKKSVAASREVYAESMYPLRFGWSPLRSLRADRFKLIDAPRPELYDLTTDALEQRNVIADYPKVADAMRRRLRAIDPDAAAPARPRSAVDRLVLDRLGSLGYVSGTAAAPSKSGHLPDPKDRMDAYNKLTSRQIQNAAFRRSFCR